MRILSAADAISPAFARTKLVLFTPFRIGRSWKLGATAYLSFAGTLFFPFPLLYLAAIPLLNEFAGHFAVTALVVGVLAFTVIYAVIFALCSRLQFAFFDIVLNRGEFVAPAWRKYGAASRSWTAIKFAIGILLAAIVALPCVPLVRSFFDAAKTLPDAFKNLQPNQPPPPQFFAFMATFYGAYFVILFFFGLYYLIMSTLSSFMLPSMALESLSPKDAFLRFVTFVKRETGAFFLFIVIRLGLGVVGYMGITLAYEIVLLLVILVVGLVLALLGFLLHLLHFPQPLLFGLGIFAFITSIFVLNGYLLGLALGSFFTAFEAHTLCFLGGRYPMLGELLERSTPPSPNVPPPLFSDPHIPPPPQDPA